MILERPASLRIEVPAPHGFLEAILQAPESPRFAAVVCHPHPLHGGTMDNNVVYRLARTVVGAGGAALRFNFRGVGRSTGSWGGGDDEPEDVTAALDLLAQRWPGLPLWATGFSFGARVGLLVGERDPRVSRLLGVGLPLSMLEMTFLAASVKPKAFVQGELDEFGAAAEVRALVERMPGPKRLWLVTGAGHLFQALLPELERALVEAVAFVSTA